MCWGGCGVKGKGVGELDGTGGLHSHSLLVFFSSIDKPRFDMAMDAAVGWY